MTGCRHYILNDTDNWCNEGHIVYECLRCKEQACALEWFRWRKS